MNFKKLNDLFHYQISTNKKELIEMLCSIKRQIEYEISIKISPLYS